MMGRSKSGGRMAKERLGERGGIHRIRGRESGMSCGGHRWGAELSREF